MFELQNLALNLELGMWMLGLQGETAFISYKKADLPKNLIIKNYECAYN